MPASEGVLYVLHNDTAGVIRYHMATGTALGGPDDFIVPGTSGLASPRSMAFAPPADADADGLPDAWEHTHGLSSANPLDAAQDADGDGQTNLAEYQSGTDPATPPAPPARPRCNATLKASSSSPSAPSPAASTPSKPKPASPTPPTRGPRSSPTSSPPRELRRCAIPNAGTYAQRNYRLRVTGQQQ